MAIGSGIGSQLGIAAETTYGTYVAPTRFLEVAKQTVSKTKNTKSWTGLASGRLVDRAGGRVVTTTAGTVSIDELVVTNRDMGLLLNAIMGGTVAPVQQGATLAYLQTHALADTAGKHLSVQAGVPLVGGTVVPQTALGCKATSAEVACAVDELLTMKVELDAREITEAQTLVAASYGANRSPFHFGQMSVHAGATIGTVAPVSGVQGISVKIDRKLAAEKFYAGGGGLKAEPTTNDMVAITGTITADYLVAADFANRFRDDTQTAIRITFTGALIDTGYYDTLTIDLPAVFFDTGTPSVDGPDVVTTGYDFTVYNDLTNAPATISYLSADTAL